MNIMLQEVLRSHRLNQFHIPANRWLAWATSLNRGRDRIFLYNHSPNMTTEQRYPLLHLLYQRWQVANWQLDPKINLSVNFILQEMLRAKSPTPYPSERLSNGLSLTPNANIPVWQFTQKVLAANIPPRQQNQNRLIGTPLTQAMPAAGYAHATPEAEFTIQANPLRQVFNRQHQNLFTRESQQILQRIVRDRQRLEENTQRTLVVRQQQDVMEAIARTPTASPHNFTGDISQSPRAIPTPTIDTININQLTEQVMRQLDSRIVAQRERMGRTF